MNNHETKLDEREQVAYDTWNTDHEDVLEFNAKTAVVWIVGVIASVVFMAWGIVSCVQWVASWFH